MSMKRLTVNEIAILLYGNASTPVSEQFIKLVRDVEDCHQAELDKQTYKAELLENRLRVITGKEPNEWKNFPKDSDYFEVYNPWKQDEVLRFSKDFVENYYHVPLSDEEIMKEWNWKYADTHEDILIKFARAIEERHGIK